MLKYCFIIDEEKGIVRLGAGCSDEYYEEIGMEKRNVDQSEIDFQWYLTEKCPHYTEEEKFQIAKTAKYKEANSGAYTYLESGKALYEFEEGKHIEATDGNIAKFTAYALGFIAGSTTPVVWSTKEDEIVTLNQEQVVDILQGLGAVQAQVWTVKYTAYVQAIEAAQTVEEIEAIVIDYTIEIEE